MTTRRGGTPLKGRRSPLSLEQLHVQQLHVHAPMLHVLVLLTVLYIYDWLGPCVGISRLDCGLLGTDGGGSDGGAGGTVPGPHVRGLSTCNAVSAIGLVVGRSVGRQGGMRSKRNGIVLRRLHIVSDPVHVTLEP